jgi:hypothetical protein
MNGATKILIVLLSISLCAAGVLLSQKEKTQDKQPKSKAVPIDNRAKRRTVWIWS